MNRSTYIAVLIALALCASCSNSADKGMRLPALLRQDGFSNLSSINITDANAKEEIHDIIKDKDNGYVVEEELEDFVYTAVWLPAEYSLLANFGSIPSDEKEVEALLQEYRQQQIIQLEIKNTKFSGELLKFELTAPDQYAERLSYISSYIQYDVLLLCGSDTLPCLNAVFERGYDAQGLLRVQLVFPGCMETDKNKKQLLFNDQLFNAGPLRFSFGRENVNA